MGITIVHCNIRSWKANRYAFLMEIQNYSPHVIMLNEISTHSTDKMYVGGYNVIASHNGPNSGVAIFIKKCLQYELIPVQDINTLAIKIFTNTSQR